MILWVTYFLISKSRWRSRDWDRGGILLSPSSYLLLILFMSIFLGVFLTVLVLLIVVMIHEFGHFITARMTGMRVEEFGIGIPPRATTLGSDKKGTLYTLNWLPIGGFVRIFGENPSESGAIGKGTFMSKPWPARVLVLSAWVMMNFVLAFVIFSFLFALWVKPVTIMPIDRTDSLLMPGLQDAVDMGMVTHSGITVMPLSGGVAAIAGVSSGSQILTINGVIPKTVWAIKEIISQGDIITLNLIDAEGGSYARQVQPKNGLIGIAMEYKNLNIHDSYTIQRSSLEAVKAGATETYQVSRLTLSFLGKMVHGLFAPKTEQEHTDAKSMVSGPIGMGSMFVQIAEVGVNWTVILIIIAMISINLGIVNILPFPALDGWRIVTTTLYSLVSPFHFGKKHFARIEWYFHTIGFVLLLILMLYVAGLDVSRFF